MNSLGIPQDRIAKRLGLVRTSLHYHLAKMAELPNSTNTDLSQGFTVSQVAEKHNWTEPMACPPSLSPNGGNQRRSMFSLRRGRRAWSLALEGREDIERFKELSWGLRTWDQWEWNDCLPREIYVNNSEAYFTAGDKRFGDDWPARHLPATCPPSLSLRRGGRA